jgi:putative transposase
MPRKPRHYIAGIPTHVVQHAKNGSFVFQNERDYRYYLSCLAKSALQHDCLVHAYTLMPDHVHLIVTPNGSNGVSGMMQSLNVSYARYGNRQYQTRGSLWKGRYRACLVEADSHLLDLHIYLEQHAVRSGLAENPENYHWSSCRIYTGLDKPKNITPHEYYYALGDSLQVRQTIYRKQVQHPLHPAIVKQFEESFRTELPLGSARFREKIETELDLNLGYARRGRPRKQTDRITYQ